MGFFSGLWRAARFSNPGGGLRPGSNAATLYTFLVLLFTIVGISLALMGFDIADVERWVDAQGGWLDAVGTFLFKVLLAFILMICALVVWAAFFDRTNPQRPGVVGVIIALIIAWFVSAGLF